MPLVEHQLSELDQVPMTDALQSPKLVLEVGDSFRVPVRQHLQRQPRPLLAIEGFVDRARRTPSEQCDELESSRASKMSLPRIPHVFSVRDALCEPERPHPLGSEPLDGARSLSWGRSVGASGFSLNAIFRRAVRANCVVVCASVR